jgi:hypothetical protein
LAVGVLQAARWQQRNSDNMDDMTYIGGYQGLF